MQTSTPTAAAGQPARHRSPFTKPLAQLLKPAPRHVYVERAYPASYLTLCGAYVQLWPRSPWDVRRWQVLVGADCATDTLPTKPTRVISSAGSSSWLQARASGQTQASAAAQQQTLAARCMSEYSGGCQ